jgi:hypothetical protein
MGEADIIMFLCQLVCFQADIWWLDRTYFLPVRFLMVAFVQVLLPHI